MPVKRRYPFGPMRRVKRARGSMYTNLPKGKGLAKSGGRRTYAGKSKFQRSVRRALLKTTETCYISKTVAQGTGASINHDTLKAFEIWAPTVTNIFPAQGLGDGNRIGDEIYVTGMKVRCQFEMPQDRRNAKIKLWYVPFDSNQGTPNVQSDFQHNVTGNTFIDPIQTKRWKGCKYLGMFQLKATDQTTGVQDKTLFCDFWIPVYKKVCFKEDGSTVPVSGLPEYGWIVATAYDTYSTFQTDTIVSRGEISCTMYYKDP